MHKALVMLCVAKYKQANFLGLQKAVDHVVFHSVKIEVNSKDGFESVYVSHCFCAALYAGGWRFYCQEQWFEGGLGCC